MKGVVPGLREREGRLGLHLPGGLRVEPREKTVRGCGLAG